MNSSIDWFRVRTIKTITRPKIYTLGPQLLWTSLVWFTHVEFKKNPNSLCRFLDLSGELSGKIGTCKNTKPLFFLLGLKYALRSCFEPKNFLSDSCPELSIHVFSFSASKFGLTTLIQILDVQWSSLDVIDNFKVFSRMVFLSFGEIIMFSVYITKLNIFVYSLLSKS